MAAKKKLYGLIDPPPRYGTTLETWERHLSMVERLPEDDLLKPHLLSTARAMVRRMRNEQKENSQAVE